MKLYIGTPYKISSTIEPRPCRNAKGQKGDFIYATPHRNAAIAYAFKPTDPSLENSPLLIPEVKSQDISSENPYAMIIGANYNLYLRGLSLIGQLYTVPSVHFQPVADPQGEHTCSKSIDVTECQHDTVSLTNTLGKNFNIWFAKPTESFFAFVENMVRVHPLEEFGRLITNQETIEQAISEGILFKIPDEEINRLSLIPLSCKTTEYYAKLMSRHRSSDVESV